MCMYMSVWLLACLFISIYLSGSLHMHFRLSLCLCISRSVCPSIYPSFSFFFFPSTWVLHTCLPPSLLSASLYQILLLHHIPSPSPSSISHPDFPLVFILLSHSIPLHHSVQPWLCAIYSRSEVISSRQTFWKSRRTDFENRPWCGSREREEKETSTPFPHLQSCLAR